MKTVVTLAVGMAFTFLCAGCQKETISVEALQAKLDDLEPKVTSVRRMATSLRKELEDAKAMISDLEGQVTQSRDALLKAAAEEESLHKQFLSYRDEYRTSILKRAPGMDLGTLTAGGKTYAAVRVKTLDAWELSFHHRDGVARVALKDLPPDLQDRFAYDPQAGAKPEAPLAISPLNLPPMGALSAAGESGAEGGAAVPAGASQTGNRQGSSSGSAPKVGEGITFSNGKTAEVLSTWGGAGGGTKVKGATATVPQGYKPIGSSFTGSSMDKNKKKDAKH